MEFLDDKAVVSSDEEMSDVDNADELDSPRKKKSSRKRKADTFEEDDDDDDEEEEDDNQVVEGLIDDNPIEESDGEESVIGALKRKHESESEDDDNLDDDDYDLIEENLGTTIKRKHQRRRIENDEDEDDEEEINHGDKKKELEERLFDADGGGVEGSPVRRDVADDAAIAESDDEYEDEDDGFIVYDDEQQQRDVKKRRTHDDAAIQEAYDVFGAEFDFPDLDHAEDDEEEEEDADYEAEDGDEPEIRPTKSTKKKKASLKQIYEPGELERAHLTDYDQEIRTIDMPERFQLRSIAVCPTEEGELDEEAEWINKNAFNTPPLSKQDYYDVDVGYSGMHRKGPSTVNKIREALNLMRNQKFEVPFIAFYRKEYIDPELNITDLWKVFHWDEKWMQLKERKQNLLHLFEQLQQFQFEEASLDKPLDASFRRLTEDDIERVKAVQTMEQLNDIHQHFNLYYANDVTRMKMAKKNKRKLAEDGGEDGSAAHDEEASVLKQAPKRSAYNICVDAGLCEMARRFGLTPEQFGENINDNYMRHEVEQDPGDPNELAEEFIKGQFCSKDHVLAGSRHIVSMQIAYDPLVRSCVRQVFQERCKMNVRPTSKGFSEIDESHQCYSFKYLRSKPIRDLQEDQYLKIHQAEEDGLLKVDFFLDDKDNVRYTYYEEIKQLFIRDEYSHVVQEWNKQRTLAVERALNVILYPILIKQVKMKLLEEAKEHVMRVCCRKLYSCLKVAPYQVDQPLDEEDEDYDTSNGLRIMGISFSDDKSEASYCAIIDGSGEVTDYLKLPYLATRRNSWIKDERVAKEKELVRLKDLILSKKPHVIAVGAESRDVLIVIDDLKNIVSELEQEQQIAPISIELIDNELARVYAASKKADHDMKEYPALLRQAVSIARRLQDPLIEFSQLCNPDEDLLSLRFHQLQSCLNKEYLLNNLYLEFVNRVNEVGVDVSRCIAHPHTSSLIQFVCGLGSRKGYYLLKTLKQNNSRLENRTQLVTHSHVGMGPKVFINCAGFIKIDTSAVVDGTDTYVEVLDGSRIHPETYEWARKMAVDALEYDDTSADANPAGALEEILESPDRLKDLDLDAFAEELERQGYGDKHITLYDIRAELNHRYKDLRTPFRSATTEERFNLLTKETPQTFYIGKFLSCKVVGVAHRKPQGEQLDMANPVRNDETGLWQCPFCQKGDFPELSEVWNHFDAGGCPGQAVGVRTRLDNGVSGFIPLKMLSDKHVSHPDERVKVNMVINCRISKIDIERFQVELTSRSSDLADVDHKWRLPYDLFYDQMLEDKDKHEMQQKIRSRNKQSYIKRVIAHPSFHNIDYVACERLMEKYEQGDVIIRPSSKGADHLTVTWKVADGVLQHIDVREEGKVNSFSLGKSLWIESESFEDLDEIIARHIQPMAAFARDILNYKYFKDLPLNSLDNRELIEKELVKERKANPSKNPYYFTTSKQHAGKFMLSYVPRTTARHEFVTTTPDGLRFRGQVFDSLTNLIIWFKEHFGDQNSGQQRQHHQLQQQHHQQQQQISRTPMMDSAALSNPWLNIQQSYGNYASHRH